MRQAEIDIVAETCAAAEEEAETEDRAEGPALLFVEVKARNGTGSGIAGEAVTKAKQERICRCADYYMNRHSIDPYAQRIRFDVVTVDLDPRRHSQSDSAAGDLRGNPENRVRITWIQNAFPYRARTERHAGPYWRVW